MIKGHCLNRSLGIINTVYTTKAAEWISNSEVENRLNVIKERLGWHIINDTWKAINCIDIVHATARQADKEIKEAKKRAGEDHFFGDNPMAIVTLASLQDVGDDDDEVELVPQEEAEEEDETGTSHLKAFVFLALFQFHWDKSFLALVSCLTSGTPGDP